MPRVLVIRYEGGPFLNRMSKVLMTMLDGGWECDVLIPQNGIGPTNVAEEMGRDVSKRVHLREFPAQPPSTLPARIVYLLSGAPLFGTRAFAHYLTGLLRTQAYDLIWVKDTASLPVAFRCLAESNHQQVRVICDMYENMTEQIYDTLVRFGSRRSRARAYLSLLVPRARRAEKRYLPRCDRIFVVVEEAKAFLVRRYGLDPSGITVVHNVEVLSDFDAIEQVELPIKEGIPLLTYVGGFGPYRGIETLLEAVPLLMKRGLSGFQVALVGAPPGELSRLAALCAEMGIQDVVGLHGFVPHRQAMRWIKQSSIGIIPHVNTMQIRTTIPNKLFQYMAAGVPCVVSDVGPLGRIVKQTASGFTFQAGSEDDLALKIASLLDNPEQMPTLGGNGRAAVERVYCWEVEGRCYSRYLDSRKSS